MSNFRCRHPPVRKLEALTTTDHNPYPERVLALEAEGITTSDAQAVADAELMGAKPMGARQRDARPLPRSAVPASVPAAAAR